MLRSKALAGIFWSLIATWGEQLITFAVLIILARLLGPEQFGIVALAGLAIYVLQDILRVTLNHTLVPMAGAGDAHLSSAFWIMVIFGISSSALVSLAAGPIANFFSEPMLAEIIPWLSLVLLLGSMEIVQEVRLVRQMRFRPLAFREICASLLGGTVAVTMAVNGYGVWSMVAQQVIASAARLVIVMVSSKWIPSFSISLSNVRDMVHLGRYVIVMSIVEFIYTRADVTVVGSYLGSHAVGLYNTGFRILRLLLNGISGALSRALLPAFSRLQGDTQRGHAAFLRTIRLSSIISTPTFIGLACVSEEAVYVLLGQKWLEAVPVVTFFGIAGAIQSIGLLCANTSLGLGKVKQLFYMNFFHAAIFVACVLIGAQFGIVGVAAGYLMAFVFIDASQVILVSWVLDIKPRQFVEALFPSLFGTACMAVAIGAVQSVIDLAPYMALPILILTGLTTYTLAIIVFSPSTKREAFSVIGEITRKRSRATVEPRE